MDVDINMDEEGENSLKLKDGTRCFQRAATRSDQSEHTAAPPREEQLVVQAEERRCRGCGPAFMLVLEEQHNDASARHGDHKRDA